MPLSVYWLLLRSGEPLLIFFIKLRYKIGISCWGFKCISSIFYWIRNWNCYRLGSWGKCSNFRELGNCSSNWFCMRCSWLLIVCTMKFMKISIIFIACFLVGYTVNGFLLHLPLFSARNAIVTLAMTVTTVSVLYLIVFRRSK